VFEIFLKQCYRSTWNKKGNILGIKPLVAYCFMPNSFIQTAIYLNNNGDYNWHSYHQCNVWCYTGRFIMFSMITNIYNKKTKGPTTMELFTATGKLKKFFLTTRDIWCVHHRWHGTHWYNIHVLVTRASTWVHRYSSLLQWFVPLGQWGHVAMVGRILCTKCTLHSNHELTRVIFQHMKRLLPRSGHFLTTYTRIA